LLGFHGSGFSGRYADLALEASSDWVLASSTEYYRPDNTTLIDTTDANGWFTFVLDNSIDQKNRIVWTGLSPITGLIDNGSNQNCQNWSTSVFSQDGRYGHDNYVNGDSVNVSNIGCNTVGHIYCVEQKI